MLFEKKTTQIITFNTFLSVPSQITAHTCLIFDNITTLFFYVTCTVYSDTRKTQLYTASRLHSPSPGTAVAMSPEIGLAPWRDPQTWRSR